MSGISRAAQLRLGGPCFLAEDLIRSQCIPGDAFGFFFLKLEKTLCFQLFFVSLSFSEKTLAYEPGAEKSPEQTQKTKLFYEKLGSILQLLVRQRKSLAFLG